MKETKRHIIQGIATFLTNANLGGFIKGDIYKGPSKHVCVPGLNCYSCPGAIGSCPIGSLQAVLGARDKNVSYYVVGLLVLFGVVLGRLICGFLCPFGFVQDLLYKIKTKKLKVPSRVDRVLRYGKYVMLLLPVILMPIFFTDTLGIGDPAFCKYICPAGTLGGGIPLVVMNETLQTEVGFLFSWKMFLLVIALVASVLIYRPFCKYVCPLGAIYGLMNKFSLYRMEIDRSKCTQCHACEKACKMQVPVLKNINSPECIRCGVCKKACPQHCIRSGFMIRAEQKEGKRAPTSE